MRNPFENNWLRYAPIKNPYEVIWLKSHYEFTQWIELNGLPTAICFDHDLGIVNNTEEKTGYDCAKWLVNYCIDNKLHLPLYNIQSSNPVGKANINGLFKSFEKSI